MTMMSQEKCAIPGWMLPAFNHDKAEKSGVLKKILLSTWGGIGDQICAEPTLRFALKQMDECEVSLATHYPEFFTHLKFKRVFNLDHEQPIWDNYYSFPTGVDHNHLLWQFVSHGLTNCLDFPSICAFRSQLPITEKEVVLKVPKSKIATDLRDYRNGVIVHAGKHWKSKTFPKAWWDSVLNELYSHGMTPILIGANVDDNTSTVDVMTHGCVDLRNKTTLLEVIDILQDAHVVLTNDSSPLHMAATGKAWIGFFATCKHPDHITHWRNGEWSWRMENLSRGGLWSNKGMTAPNASDAVLIDEATEDQLLSWLPSPLSVAKWAQEKGKQWTNQ